MRPTTRRERTLAIAAGACVGLAILVEAVFLPKWSQYRRLSEEARRLETTLAHMRGNVLQKDDIEARHEQLRDMIHESGTPSQEMSRFARILTEICGNVGLETRFIRPLPDEDHGLYRQSSLSLEMEGPVSEIARFLASIARAADPIRVARIEMTCRERPEVVHAKIVVTKVSTTTQPAVRPRPGPRPAGEHLVSGVSAR